MTWYCAKAIEAYKYADDDRKFPIIIDENLYLVEAVSLAEARCRSERFAEEMAAVWRSPLYVGGAKGRVVSAGLRSIEKLDVNCIECGMVVSSSLYEASNSEASQFVQESKVLQLTYLNPDSRFSIKTENIACAKLIGKTTEQYDELWWHSAHLVYSLTSRNSRPLILEEVAVFEYVSDEWREAETLGLARAACSKVSFGGVEYEISFKGVRQVAIIHDAEVGTGLQSFGWIGQSKFEIASQQQFERLLSNQDCILALLPSSLCNLSVPDSA